MKYNIKTSIVKDSITQEISSEMNDIVTVISREVYDTKERQLINGLIKLGWTPPVKGVDDYTEDNLPCMELSSMR